MMMASEPVATPSELAPLDRGDSSSETAPQDPLKSVEDVQPEETTIETERVAMRGRANGPKLLVRGRVVDSKGNPVRMARVYVREFEEPEFRIDDYDSFSGKDSANQDGEFQVRVDRQGDFRVWAQGSLPLDGPGKTTSSSSRVASVSLSPQEPEVELELEVFADRSIEGIVLREDLVPLAGVEVVAYVDVEGAGIELPSDTTSIELYGLSKARSGSDGKFWLHPVRDMDVKYVVRAESQTPVRTQQTGAQQLQLEVRSASMQGVRAGSSGLSLILAPPSASSLRLEVSSESGLLPEMLQAKLQRVGPNGGIYNATRSWQALDSQGMLRMGGVDPGSRYQVALTWTGSVEELTVGPIVATTSEVSVPVELPGLYRATVTAQDSDAEPGDRYSVTATHIDERGVRKRVLSQAADAGERSVEITLSAGSYELQMMKRRAGRRVDTAVGVLGIVMPERDTDFTVEVR